MQKAQLNRSLVAKYMLHAAPVLIKSTALILAPTIWYYYVKTWKDTATLSLIHICMGSVKVTEKIDMIIQLELWDQNKVYDRMGMENEYTSILGLKIPSLTIPVKPGRNLAIIIEVAAMNNRQKKMGYNAAQELLEKLGMVPSDDNGVDWNAY